jgi:hypothetical protein
MGKQCLLVLQNVLYEIGARSGLFEVTICSNHFGWVTTYSNQSV